MTPAARPAVHRAALAALLAFASPALAVPVVNTFAENGAAPFSPTFAAQVSASDLINGLAPTSTAGDFTVESGGGTPALTNGTIGIMQGGNPGLDNSIFATAGDGNGSGQQVVYTLNLIASPGGYNITGVTTYGGWNDQGRDQQAYTLAFATVSEPLTFVDYQTVDFNPVAGGDPSATQVIITDSLGTLATNIGYVRFTFNAVENGHTGYTELDVFGTPVPEPGTVALLALPALVVAGRMLRRRAGN